MSEQFEQKEEDRWEHREGEMQAERVFWNFLSAGVHQCGLKVSKKLEDKSALAWVSLGKAQVSLCLSALSTVAMMLQFPDLSCQDVDMKRRSREGTLASSSVASMAPAGLVLPSLNLCLAKTQ